jgi:hypothetical protein
MVMLKPDVVHTLVVEDEIETASPELAVGATENGVAENSFVPGFVNVMVWFALPNVMVVAEDDTGS